MMKRTIYLSIILATLFGMAQHPAFSRVVKEDGKTFIIDRTAERWDVTQAESIGFTAEKFQYGLGRYVFAPLDDSYLSDDIASVPESLRVIGVVADSEAKAYSIRRLFQHEVDKSTLGTEPIAVAF